MLSFSSNVLNVGRETNIFWKLSILKIILSNQKILLFKLFFSFLIAPFEIVLTSLFVAKLVSVHQTICCTNCFNSVSSITPVNLLKSKVVKYFSSVSDILALESVLFFTKPQTSGILFSISLFF